MNRNPAQSLGLLLFVVLAIADTRAAEHSTRSVMAYERAIDDMERRGDTPPAYHMLVGRVRRMYSDAARDQQAGRSAALREVAAGRFQFHVTGFVRGSKQPSLKGVSIVYHGCASDHSPAWELGYNWVVEMHLREQHGDTVLPHLFPHGEFPPLEPHQTAPYWIGVLSCAAGVLALTTICLRRRRIQDA